MIRKMIGSVSYAKLRGTPRSSAYTLRSSAYTLRSFAGTLWKLLKFLGLGNSNDNAARRSFGFDVALIAERVHPALECARIEACFLLDLAVADRLAPEHPAERTRLVRLTQDQPTVEPNGRAHTCVVLRLEEHSPQSRAVVFLTHQRQ